MFAFTGFEILHHLVSHFEPFELHDADEFVAVFPDLPLLQLDRHANECGREFREKKSVSPDLKAGETAIDKRLSFLAGLLFGSHRLFPYLIGLADLRLFL